MLGSLVGCDPMSTIQNNVPDDLFGTGALYSARVIYNTTTGDTTWAMFRWVRAEDADFTAGDPVYPTDVDGEATMDVSGGSRKGDTALGIAIVACTDGNYCWVQCGGRGVVAITCASSDFSAGDAIVADTGADSMVDTMAAGEEDHVIGTATAASSSSELAIGAYILHGMI